MINSEELGKLYEIRFAEDELPRKYAIWAVICQEFLQQFIKSTDVIVDVASGYGEFINNINAKKKIAVDLNPNAGRFLNSDIELYSVNATNFSSVLNEEGGVNVVFTSNFLEHLPGKATLDTFLNEVMVALKPGGKYLILGPNLRYLPGQYWDYYDHHLGLTHLSLSEALKLKGFELEVCIDRFLPFSTKSFLPTNPWLVWVYLKIPLVWKLLGKQFFIVARKPT